MERMTGAKTLRAIIEGVEELTARTLGDAGPTAVATAPQADASREAEPAGSTRRLPFIDHVLSHEPGRRLIAECEMDVARHRFLMDHTFFGRELSMNGPPGRAG